MNEERPIGHTSTQGWEMGIRRTLPISPDAAWALIVQDPGRRLWLGTDDAPDFRKGAAHTLTNGTRIEIRSHEPGALLRMRWHPADWTAPSTLQIRVLPAATGTTISFHQEHLPDGDVRQAMLVHWRAVLDQFTELVDGSAPR